MNGVKVSMIAMVVALVIFVVAFGFALGGCASAPRPPREIRTFVTVDGPTRLVTGPARGHWEEDNHLNLIYYTVLGTDCNWLSRQIETPTVDTDAPFILAPGVSLCVLPLRDHPQYVKVHARFS